MRREVLMFFEYVRPVLTPIRTYLNEVANVLQAQQQQPSFADKDGLDKAYDATNDISIWKTHST